MATRWNLHKLELNLIVLVCVNVAQVFMNTWVLNVIKKGF